MSKRSTHVLTVSSRQRSRHSQLPILLVTGMLSLLFLYMSYTCLTFGTETSGSGTGFPDLPFDTVTSGLTDPISTADPTPATIDTAVAPADDLHYFYSQLSAEDKEVYDQLLTCLQDHTEELTLTGTSSEKMEALLTCVLSDHPELFWMGSSYHSASLVGSTVFYPIYNRTAAQVSAEQPLVDSALQTAQDTIGQPASEYETVKAVYEYIVRTVDYVSGDDDQNIISSLVDHASVCAGYSRGMQLLLQQYGIQSIYTTGTVIDSGPHAWLVVRIDGNYYNVDVTFADRNSENDVVPDMIGCNYAYLCVPDDLFYQDRLQDPSYLSVPSCTQEDLEYYRMNDHYFTSYDEAAASMEQNLRSGELFWEGQFDTPELYQQLIDSNPYSTLAIESGISGTFRTVMDDDARIVTCYYTAA